MTTTAYIALGSNLGNPQQQLDCAVAALQKLPQSEFLALSPWYQSKPHGPVSQPDYLNGVAAIATELTPAELLRHLQAIENRQGRVRLERWGPRTLDLDILLYGNEIIALPDLIIPHPAMKQRNFVLLPLADIAPALVLPDGTALQQLLENTGTDGIVRLAKHSLHDSGNLNPAR